MRPLPASTHLQWLHPGRKTPRLPPGSAAGARDPFAAQGGRSGTGLPGQWVSLALQLGGSRTLGLPAAVGSLYDSCSERSAACHAWMGSMDELCRPLGLASLVRAYAAVRRSVRPLHDMPRHLAMAHSASSCSTLFVRDLSSWLGSCVGGPDQNSQTLSPKDWPDLCHLGDILSSRPPMWQPLCTIVTVLGKAFWRRCARGVLHAWPAVANVPQVTRTWVSSDTWADKSRQ